MSISINSNKPKIMKANYMCNRLKNQNYEHMKRAFTLICCVSLSLHLYAQNSTTIAPGLNTKVLPSNSTDGFYHDTRLGLGTIGTIINSTTNIGFLQSSANLNISTSSSGILPNLNLSYVGSSNNYQTITTHNNYTKLGYDAPAIKVKLFSGLLPSTVNPGSPAIFKSFLHYLDASKILSIKTYIDCGTAGQVSSNYTFNPGFEFLQFLKDNTIDIVLRNSNSANLLGKPFKVYVTYEK
jgi:hypothetical protein